MSLLFFFLLLQLDLAHAEKKFPEQSIESFSRPKSYEIESKNLIQKVSHEKLLGLGKMLFFDPRLSKSRLMSCATCHNPSFYWTDSLSTSIEDGTRKTMSLLNIGFDNNFTWTLQAKRMTNMMMQPLSAPNGMNANINEISKKLSQVLEYQKLFNEIYGPLSKKDSVPIEYGGIAFALEFYINSLISPISRFDKYIEGSKNALNEEEIAGFNLFRGKANCAQCHSGWRLSDGKSYDIGLKLNPKDPILRKKDTPPLFKAVGLRGIAQRPPYMHDGSIKNLVDIIEFYNKGGDEKRPSLSDKITKLNLSKSEKDALLAFLFSLNEDPINVILPILPR